MVIADTGFWLALSNRKDDYHVVAKEALAALTQPLITTWPVVTETCHLLLNRLGNAAQIAFIKSYQHGAFKIFDLDESHAPRLAALISKYDDLPMDLADASLVILAEHLGDGAILTTDQRDFATYRFKNHKPFRNILLKNH